MPNEVFHSGGFIKKWFYLMSDNFIEFSNAALVQNRVCGVSYTLNNEQPVICTHIGDQPLYYADEENIEDDDIFDFSELGFLEDEIKILKQELADMDSSDLFISEDTIISLEEFAQNAESFSVDYSLADNEKYIRIDYIKNILGNSRLASAYLNIAEKHNVEIIMSAQVEKSFYDRNSSTILINPNIDINDQVILLARELRCHWQHRCGALINPLIFQPEHSILINRAQEADLAVSIVRIAWELQLAGNKEIWERVENSPMSDLTRAYAREAFLDFRTINNGIASSAVFEAWFLSERCRHHDKNIIQMMLADCNGYVFENVDLPQNVSVELISALGNMPFGKNYLSEHALIIMNDPVFSEVRDRSNANFLWFIKFERRFKETEQHLQSESDLSTCGISHDLLNESQDQNYDSSSSADIIQLFEHPPATRGEGSEEHLRGSGDSAQIINLKCWANTKQNSR